MLDNSYFILAAYVLDYTALALVFCFGVRFIIQSRDKSDIAKKFQIGLGLFFITVALSSMIYMMDLTNRTYFGARIFPSDQEYDAMGYIFDSFHKQYYFIIILAFLSLSMSFLIRPIELHMLNRPRPILSWATLILSPLPFIIRVLELQTLPQEGGILYYVYTGLYILVWFVNILSILILIMLYVRMVVKGTGDLRIRSLAVIVAMIVWLGVIFAKSSSFKNLENSSQAAYMFWIVPALEIAMLGLFVFGFAQSMELEKSRSETTYLYQNWFFQLTIVALWISFAVYGSIIAWNMDYEFVIFWRYQSSINPALDAFGEFNDRSITDEGEIGLQDLTFLIIAVAVILYLLSLLPKLQEKWAMLRIHTGFLIVVIIVISIVNRMFKTFFARVRPGSALSDPSRYSRIWEMGKYTLDDAFSAGSFTSGHTTTAVFLVALAFIAIKTHKSAIISALFVITIALTGVMGFGRMVHGAHYFGDVIWAALVGVALIALIYFKILKIPERETGKITFLKKMDGSENLIKVILRNAVELKYGIVFVFFAVFLLVFLLGIKYTIMEFEWYWPIAIVVGALFTGIFYRILNRLVTPVE